MNLLCSFINTTQNRIINVVLEAKVDSTYPAQGAFASGAIFLESMKQQAEINHSSLLTQVSVLKLSLIQKETSEG